MSKIRFFKNHKKYDAIIVMDELKESDHDRDKGGKFTSGSGGTSSTSSKESGSRFSKSDMPETPEGAIRLYHGTNGGNIEKISSESFGGLFGSPNQEAAESHGENMHFMDVQESEIASSESIEEKYESEDGARIVDSAVDRWSSSDASDETKDLIKNAAIYDESVFDMDDDDAEAVREALGADDIGSANWEIQTLRGQIAKQMGFKAVEMSDEHGTSYLVLPNNKVFGMDRGIAMDSARHIDKNGHLIVDRTVITKAAVNPYRGSEIPNYVSLGLDPDRIYNLLRCPLELERGMNTFAAIQLLLQHIPVDANKPEKESTVGAIGSEFEMDDEGRVWAMLRVHDQEGIDYIQSGKMQELSAGYSYTPDMTAGEYNGVSYDGIMRNIHGNHVAIVERGRIGSDAVVADEMPNEIEEYLMSKKIALKKGAIAELKTQLGMDSDEAVKKHILAVHAALALDEDKDDKEYKAEDEIEIIEKKAEDEDDDKADKKKAEDEDDKDKDDKKPAMDAALIAQDAKTQVMGIFSALRKVEPLVGQLAMDGFNSASDVYAYALKQKGVATKGINEAGLSAMVDMHVAGSTRTIAQDSAPVAASKETADKLARFKGK